ncbi:glycosyltransferase family 2 protein [Alkalicaulis satelles]|uniref:Glycosyltransferase family 2 protein n=1 Tax=Alkalicaulis satelles TaxID=2609175 RepID=A0A5M6ZQB7_9PROT|nr:glycosyltransferase family 2 protein [Alkalicaulis satelles]KAA5805448.1 glycosyltransferase family 2 protein [Alkalicaulis satelles]
MPEADGAPEGAAHKPGELHALTRQLSVIMVSYRTGPALFAAIEAALSARETAELVLVNHDNPRKTVLRLEALARANPKLRLIHSGGNLGFARGCNLGVEHASGDVFLFLNPDAILPPDAAARMMKTLDGLTEPAIVGARLTDPSGVEQRGGRRGELTLGSAFAGYLGLSRFVPFVRDVHREHEPLPETAEPSPVVSGAAMMFTRAGFEQLGGFDEGYFLHVEDIDICRRARDAGGQVMFEPRVSVLHYGSTSKASLFLVESWKARGLIRYFQTHSGAPGQVLAVVLGPFMWLALMARAVMVRLRQHVCGRLRRLAALKRLMKRRRNGR